MFNNNSTNNNNLGEDNSARLGTGEKCSSFPCPFSSCTDGTVARKLQPDSTKSEAQIAKEQMQGKADE